MENHRIARGNRRILLICHFSFGIQKHHGHIDTGVHEKFSGRTEKKNDVVYIYFTEQKNYHRINVAAISSRKLGDTFTSSANAFH